MLILIVEYMIYMETFPMLYKDDRVWNIRVEKTVNGGVIHREYGKVDGKMIHTSKEITFGKNQGKKNETTAYEQACKDATSLWTNQQTTLEYTPSQCGGTTRSFNPMLAKTYIENDKMKFPCLVQPKLDGVRLLIFMNDTNEIVMQSRTGKNMDNIHLQHIKKRCQEFFDSVPREFKLICLDGELFSKYMKFEDIVSTSRSNKVLKDEVKERIQYHVYDVICEGSMKYRSDLLIKLMSKIATQGDIKLVRSHVCSSHEEVMQYHSKFINDNYEGIMIRAMDKPYVQKRSDGLQKYKSFMDDEFEIVSVKEGTGNDKGTAIFECLLHNQTTFYVRPIGIKNYRKKLLSEKENLVGKMLTVTFQEYTDRGVPRFPVGKTIRDYE
jgi:ATP-dependent DNA ligase